MLKLYLYWVIHEFDDGIHRYKQLTPELYQELMVRYVRGIPWQDRHIPDDLKPHLQQVNTYLY